MPDPVGYDAFVGRLAVIAHTPAAGPTAAQLGVVLRDLRSYRRVLQEINDDAKDSQATEPRLEVANQMEEVVQNLAGTLSKLDCAIPALERAQANLAQYPAILERVDGLIRSVRGES